MSLSPPFSSSDTCPVVSLSLALPKGRMQQGVFALLDAAGISVRLGARGYRPTVGLPATEAKLLISCWQVE